MGNRKLNLGVFNKNIVFIYFIVESVQN